MKNVIPINTARATRLAKKYAQIQSQIWKTRLVIEDLNAEQRAVKAQLNALGMNEFGTPLGKSAAAGHVQRVRREKI